MNSPRRLSSIAAGASRTPRTQLRVKVRGSLRFECDTNKICRIYLLISLRGLRIVLSN